LLWAIVVFEACHTPLQRSVATINSKYFEYFVVESGRRKEET
jgi:hypothetical protein